MGVGDLIPDRRRKHFPLNGGPRPSDADKKRGRRGAARARAVLDAVTPRAPTPPVVVRQMGSKVIRRARVGIQAARDVLRDEEANDPETRG